MSDEEDESVITKSTFEYDKSKEHSQKVLDLSCIPTINCLKNKIKPLNINIDKSDVDIINKSNYKDIFLPDEDTDNKEIFMKSNTIFKNFIYECIMESKKDSIQ